MIRTRRRVKNEKQIVVERFYNDWAQYTAIHARSASGDSFERRINEDGSITLKWNTPQFELRDNISYDDNSLHLTLLHPSRSFKQISFMVSLYTGKYGEADSTTLYRENMVSIVPTLNLPSSIIMTKVIILINNVLRRKHIHVSVTNVLFTIFNSILFQRYTVSPTLYDWNNYYE